ncbi:glyoxalase [Bacillus sp. JCM 19046]|nr:glyoxalase [Bacillus sp. JCM 19045]GAF17133.1 glyoxalase [Bacillus sp. JCM 19046]
MFKPNPLTPELSVANLTKSLNFYVNLLSFKIEYERKEDLFAMVSLQGSQLMLEQVNGHWQTAELAYPFGRGINFQMAVDSIEEIYRTLLLNKYPIKVEIQENWYRAGERSIGQKEFLVMDLMAIY